MNDLSSSLNELADLFIAEMRSVIKEKNLPQHIYDAIYKGSPQVASSGEGSITITIPLSEAPSAAAYEWGSGERAEGGGEEYRIPNEPKIGIRIPEENWPDFEFPIIPGIKMIGAARDGGFALRYVEHPGVFPKPYIRPSIVKILAEAKKIFGEYIDAELSILETNSDNEIIKVTLK